jgi:hypothetical protein
LNDFNIRSENVSEYTETGAAIVSVQRDKLQSVKFYVSTPLLNLVDDSVDVTFTIKELESGETDIQSTTFKGPKKRQLKLNLILEKEYLLGLSGFFWLYLRLMEL